MAKKPETSISLEKLIPIFGKNKMQADEFKKAADLANKRIKEIMSAKGLTEKEAGGFIVKYSVRTTESFNEPALLEFLKGKKEFKDCIKTREYIDMDELENVLYQGKLPKKLLLELDKFRQYKDTEYLTVNKVKED